MKSFETIRNEILRDIRGQSVTGTDGKPRQVDTSAGSVAMLFASTMAAMEWGLLAEIDKAKAEVFADTASTAGLEHHAASRGITRKPGETDDELLARLLRDIRTPEAGGTVADYERWAERVAGVKTAHCTPVPQGAGSVDVVVVADADLTGSETPDAALLDAVRAEIEAVFPVGVTALRILAPVFQSVDVSVTVTGDVTALECTAALTDYLAAMGPGTPATLDRMKFTLYGIGAETFAFAAPAQDIDALIDESAGTYTINRPGEINVIVS